MEETIILNFEWQVLNAVCIDQNKLIATHDQVLTVKASSHSYASIRSECNIIDSSPSNQVSHYSIIHCLLSPDQERGTIPTN